MPLEQLPHALQASEQEFEAAHGGQRQPQRGQGWLVLCSRREVRAAWAAQVAHDAGFHQCLILRQVGRLYINSPIVNSWDQLIP